MKKPLKFEGGELLQEDGSVWETDALDVDEGGTYVTFWIEAYINSEVAHLPVKIYFDHQPYEASTRDYPGCQEEVTVNSVVGVGFSMGDLDEILVDANSDLDQVVLEAIHRQDERNRFDRMDSEIDV